MRKTLLVTVAAACALTACGKSEPVVGIIVEKEYEAAVWTQRNEPVYSNTCTGSGSKQSCTTRKTGSRIVTVLTKAECYEFELDTGWEGCVSRKAYDALIEGDEYRSDIRY